MVQGTYKERGLWIIDTLFQQLLAVFVLLILWEVFKNYSFSNIQTWHIVLCTLGVALCMAEGLLLYNRENSFLKDTDRATRGTIHGAIMLISFVFISVGIGLKVKQKSDAGRSHFTSAHGILGLVAWILAIISVILGILAINVQKFATLGRPALYKFVHLLIGVTGYVIAVVTLGYGLHHLEGVTGTNGRNALIVFLSLYVAYSLIGPIKSCYNYFIG